MPRTVQLAAIEEEHDDGYDDVLATQHGKLVARPTKVLNKRDFSKPLQSDNKDESHV